MPNYEDVCMAVVFTLRDTINVLENIHTRNMAFGTTSPSPGLLPVPVPGAMQPRKQNTGRLAARRQRKWSIDCQDPDATLTGENNATSAEIGTHQFVPNIRGVSQPSKESQRHNVVIH